MQNFCEYATNRVDASCLHKDQKVLIFSSKQKHEIKDCIAWRYALYMAELLCFGIKIS